MSSEKCWIRGKAPKVQRSSCTPRWYFKRRLRILRSIHWTRIFSIWNDSSKSHGYHLQTARMLRTSNGRSVCLYPSENGRSSQIIENSQNLNVQTFGFVYTDTNGLNHGPTLKNQLFQLKRICMVILWQDWLSTVGRKFPFGNVFFVHRQRGLFLCMWMT